MTKTEYKEYLQSEHWKQIRKQAIENSCSMCLRCTMPRWLASIAYDQDLHAHHKSYARLGTKEELHDIEVLCRRCHELETFNRTDLKEPKSAECDICGDKHWDPYTDRCGHCARVIDGGVWPLETYLDVAPVPTGQETLREGLLERLGFLLGDAFIVRHAARFLYVLKICSTEAECYKEAVALVSGGVRDSSGADERLSSEVARFLKLTNENVI